MSFKGRSRSSLGLSVRASEKRVSSSQRSKTPTDQPVVIVTSPPWARDETPSPEERDDPLDSLSTSGNHRHGPSRASLLEPPGTASTPGHPPWDTLSSSTTSSHRDTEESQSRWHIFTRPRRIGLPSIPLTTSLPPSGKEEVITSPENPENETTVNEDNMPGSDPRPTPRSRSSWFIESADRLLSRYPRRQASQPSSAASGTARSDITVTAQPFALEPVPATEGLPNESSPVPQSPTLSRLASIAFPMPRRRQRNSLHLDLPSPPRIPENAFTRTQAQTPGWDIPWVPHQRLRGGRTRQLPGVGEGAETDQGEEEGTGSSEAAGAAGVWSRRRKKWRHFCLHHNLVPLIFRMLNLALTTTTLGVAIKERQLERDNHVLGVMGSSITLMIIFAPLTIVHVLIGTYLEYFGRPLGLWRTSWKLFYTLSETVFICLWSALLALIFDHYYTSPLRCVSPSSNDWWNSLPPVSSPVTSGIEAMLGDNLCDHAIALIVLVFFALIAYCASLFVSLFRIFEKVKFRTRIDLSASFNHV